MTEEERLAAIARGDIVEDGADDEAAAKAAAEAEAKAKEEEAAGKNKDEDEDDDTGADGKKRDEKGRFVKSTESEGKDEKDEDEDEEDEEGADKKQDVPNADIRIAKLKKQRDEARREREALESRIAALEAATKGKAEEEADPVAEIEAKLDALYKQVEEFRADAKTDDAAKTQREIDRLNRQLATLEAQHTATEVVQHSSATSSYARMLQAVEARVPELNPDHEDYDEDLENEIAFQVDAFEGKGLSRARALQRAVFLTFRVDVTKPPEEKKEEPKPAKKKTTDVKGNMEKAAKQGPDLTKTGVSKDDVPIDTAKLSAEDLRALPKEVLSRLRGDTA